MTENSWTRRRVFHWAHRGGGRENPSNTLRAMRHALVMGAHGLELDVHCTNDTPAVVVVAHDDKLRKMTGAKGRIRDSLLDELRILDAGFNWVPGKVSSATLGTGEQHLLRGHGPADPDLRIPTLDEVFAEFPDTLLNLELKSKRVAKPLADLLVAWGRSDVIVGSFRDWRLWRFRRHAPDIPTSAGGVRLVLFWLASRLWITLPLGHHVAVQAPWRLGPKRVCDGRFVGAAHSQGVAVHVWTVDDPNAMHDAIDLGVDGIMTDRPSVMGQVLTDRAAGWRGSDPVGRASG